MNHVDGHDTRLLHVTKKLFALLTRPERIGAIGMLSLTFVASIFDVLGLATVIPVINVAVNPESANDVGMLIWLSQLLSSIGIEGHAGFLMTLCGLLILVFGAKASINLYITWIQSQFSYRIAHRISGLMWDYHFSKNLERMRSSQSGEVLAEINGWPIGIGGSFLSNVLRICQEVMVMVVIGIAMLTYSPEIILVIILIMVAGSLTVRKLTKKRMVAYGNVIKELGPRNASLITNSVRGALELWSFRAVNAVRDKYLINIKLLFRLNVNTAVISTIPSKLYEVLAVIAISCAICLPLILGGDSDLELLSVLAIGAYRIMPSLSRLNNAVISMRRGMFVVHVIHDALEGRNDGELRSMNNSDSVIKSKFSVSCKGLTLGYEALENPVIRDLNCAFESGKIYAIVGASGSGKSTLINALLGVHPVQSGVIEICSEEGRRYALHEDLDSFDWMKSIGYLSQLPFLFNGSVRENMVMMVPDEKVDEETVLALLSRFELLETLGLTPLDFILNEGGTNLSGGQQQRLALVRALQHSREVLILDEATSALDERMRDIVFEELRKRSKQGCCIILVTHDLDIAKDCDRVLELEALDK